jgi:hypothetical protein
MATGGRQSAEGLKGHAQDGRRSRRSVHLAGDERKAGQQHRCDSDLIEHGLGCRGGADSAAAQDDIAMPL